MKKISLGILVCCLMVSLAVMAAEFFKRPTVSVIMSTYNREKVLPRAIDSILNGSFKDFEFIIVDDGSGDSTPWILQKYALRDNRIIVLTNERNEGLVPSLNRALDAARGQYIARMDDDDISMPDRLKKQVDFMNKNPDIAVVSSWVAPLGSTNPYPFQQETDPDKIKILPYLRTVPISHPASFIRRDFLEKHHIRYNPSYVATEDRPFWLDIMDKGGKITVIPEVLLQYHLHFTNPDSYYIKQYQNAHKFYVDVLLPRFGNAAELSKLPDCVLFKKMVELNKTKKVVNQKKLEQMVDERCPSLRGEPVLHKIWSDAFIFKGTKVCREKMPAECATIITRTNDLLKIKWDRWGTETFKKNNQGEWVVDK